MLIFLLTILTLPTVGYFLIRQQSVQNYLVQRIASKISKFLGAPVTISSAKLDVFNNIIFTDFCVQTPHSDTILYAPKLEIKVNVFSISSKYLEIKKITMTNPEIRFYVDSLSVINFQFIVNKLEAKDTLRSAHPMMVSIREINLVNADFSLKSYYSTPKKYGINFSNLHLKPMNLKVTNFRIDRGVSMNIRNLSFADHSGFNLQKLTARFKIDKENLIFNNLNILLPQSDIEANQVALNFHSGKELKAGVFGKKVKMNVDMEPSAISTDDIAWFLPFLKDNHINAKVSGRFYGRFGDLKGKNLDITYGKRTKIKANLDINGLPDLPSSFIHLDIKSLYTTPEDIQSIRVPKNKNGRIILPPNFSRVAYITYKGKFTGFLNDFVAYGTIASNLGSLESDLSLKPDTSDYFSFNGRLKANQFDIGKFIDKSDIIGKISLNAQMNGVAGSLKNTRARFDGVVNSFFFNGYNYQNIKIDGLLANNTYDGSLSIADPNANLDFLGNVDLSDSIPKFNFKANIKGANLNALHFEKQDTSAFVSLYATADFAGNNIDNLNGEIKLWNSTLRRANKQIQINDFLLFTKTVKDTNRIILRSDLADAELWGKYQFKELKNSFIALTRHFLPSLVADQPVVGASKNNFKFEIEFKDSRQFTDFFVPGLYISKDSKLSGSYDPSRNYLDFDMTVPLLQHNSKKWYNASFNGRTIGNTFSVISGSNDLKLNNQVEMQNFSLAAEVKNDSLAMNLHWNNWDSISYKGNLIFAATFKPSNSHYLPSAKLQIKPSKFILKDTIWDLNSGLVNIDSTGIKIDKFLLSHTNQTIKIDGCICKDKDKALSAEFRNVDLGNISTILNTKKLLLNGIVNGGIDVSNFYDNPIFHASLTIDSLSINREPLGNTSVSAQYNNSDKEIKIQSISERGGLKILDIKGAYATTTKNLDFDIELDKLKADIFEPYISNIFSNIKGMASGSVKLTGNINDPQLDGSVKLQKASFVVNYTKTKYNFTHTIELKKNTFIFKNVEIFDNQTRANKALVNGHIEYRKLKDIYSDIRINATNFNCLNTQEKDNNIYYGQAYATGNIRIQTSPKGVVMDIDATSDPNTVISIPLTTKAGQNTESGFIHFVKKYTAARPFDQYEIDNPIESRKNSLSTKFNLNCNLHATPDAGIQIIFDQKLGDMIRGSGSGDINIVLDGGTFNMYGTYTIDEGSYTFTLPNVLISWPFVVERGGKITWDGSPFDAIIDVNAVYTVRKASLYQLTADENYKNPVTVDCKLHMTDKLLSPSIQYDINLPYASQQDKNLLETYINTDEAKSRQFLSLLFSKNFMSDPNANTVASSPFGITAATSTGFEFLSTQVSRMLSQFSKDVEIGFNYRPGDKVTTAQAEMIFGTQLINDRLILNGNVDVGGNNQVLAANKNTSNIVGEGNIEFKLNEKGKFRLKAFNRSNQQSSSMLSDFSPYTQGVGLFYKEDFNSFKDLMKNYFDKLFGRKEEKPKPVEENTDESGGEE